MLIVCFFDGGYINNVFVSEKLEPDMSSEISFILSWAIVQSIFIK